MPRPNALCFLLAGLLAAPGLAAEPAELPYQRAHGAITLPEVTLVNQLGARVPFNKVLDSGKVVILQFVFGTSASLSPMLSASFQSLQASLGAKAKDVQFLSITVDPDHDSPKVGRAYLQRFQAQPGWDFLTGRREDLEAVQRAFTVWVPNKTYLFPVTFLHGPKSERWVKITGLMSASEFLQEFARVENQ